MKLELKHLAPYLPYGLKVIRENTFIEDDFFTIYGATKDNIYINSDGNLVLLSKVKPILRPLSDLTEDLLCISWIENIQEKELESECPYEVWQVLFENHFDVLGLIEKGLAININTL